MRDLGRRRSALIVWQVHSPLKNRGKRGPTKDERRQAERLPYKPEAARRQNDGSRKRRVRARGLQDGFSKRRGAAWGERSGPANEIATGARRGRAPTRNRGKCRRTPLAATPRMDRPRSTPAATAPRKGARFTEARLHRRGPRMRFAATTGKAATSRRTPKGGSGTAGGRLGRSLALQAACAQYWHFARDVFVSLLP